MFDELSPAASIVVVVTSILIYYANLFQHIRRKQVNDNISSPGKGDPFAIERCPNPNCIRCHRYAQVNAYARQCFPSVVDGLKQKYLSTNQDITSVESDLRRVEEALQLGRNQDDIAARATTGVSPTLGQYPTVLLVRKLSAQPFVTHLHRDTCVLLEEGDDRDVRQTILNEYLGAHQCEGSLPTEWLQNDVNENGMWEVLHIMNQGEWNEANMAKCPQTTAFVMSLPGIMGGCMFGNAFISVLHPGTTIEPHCGPSNVRHRLHLALQLPETDEEAPTLTVAGERRKWVSGQCFVFDDSIVHSVDYPASLPGRAVSSRRIARVVLIVDLWHPQLTDVERDAIAQLYSPTTYHTYGQGDND